MSKADEILTAGGDEELKELINRLIERLKAEGLSDSKILDIISDITK